jgi:hypothetical protein
MSRFSNLIDQLDDLDQQDIKNTAKLLGITAVLYERLQGLVDTQANKKTSLPEVEKITKEFLIQRYGNYSNAYNAYQEAYGIKCKTGWNNLLPLVQDLPIPLSIKERLNELEINVQSLSQIILELVQNLNLK